MSAATFTKMTILNPKRAGKIFSKVNDKLKKETVGYYSEANASLLSVNSYSELKSVIQTCSANDVILAGTSTHEHLKVRPKSKKGIGEASRDAQSFPFGAAPGLLVIDTDEADKRSTGGFESIRHQLHTAIPQLASYSMLQTTSTGANVVDASGELLTGVTGIHTLFMIQDATDVPRALEILHQRLWLAGYGYIFIGETGTAFDRSIVDLAMRESSQPLYMRAHLDAGMSQNKQIEIYEAELGDQLLDTKEALKDLSAQEVLQFNKLVTEAKYAYRDACSEQAKAYIDKRIKEMKAKGFSHDEAVDVVAASLRNNLYEDAEICLSDGQIVTVKEILSDPEQYHEVICRDPLEWSYGGAQVAKIFSSQDKPLIRSFAHHGQIFYLHEGKPPTAADDFADDFTEKNTSTHEPTHEDEEGDIYLAAIESIKIDECAFYGLLANIVEKGTQNSEATKVGIAAGLIAQWSMFLEPFYIEIGDEKVGCNINVLSVGQSGHARKGTSSELPNRILAPGIRERASMLCAAQEEISASFASASAQLIDKENQLKACKKRLSALANFDSSDIEKIQAEIEATEVSIAIKQKSLEQAKAKLDAVFGTKGYDIRLNNITKAESILLMDNKRLIALTETLKEFELALSQPELAMQFYQDKAARLMLETDSLKAKINHLSHRPSALSPALANLGRPLNEIYSVSSGEGIIEAIRDPSTYMCDGKEIEDPGVLDKRLFIDVAEFGGILALTKRNGSILSAVIRNAYDCKPLETNTRRHPVAVQSPYVSISGAITPNEFNGLLFDKADIAKNADNGFSNRFLPIFVHRTKLVAMPTRTEGTKEMIDGLWKNILMVYQSLNPSDVARSTLFPMDADADAYWRHEYKRITTLKAASSDAQRLFGRLETNTRKLAVILATMNGEVSVSLPALKAANAWIDYSAGTINKIVATVEDRMRADELGRIADKVLDALYSFGGQASFSQIAKKLNLDTKKTRPKLESAIASLSHTVPAVIDVVNVKKINKDGRSRAVKEVRLVEAARC